MKIVIIEDEAMNVDDLITTLNATSHIVEIAAILPTVKQSIEFFQNECEYDLIFCDVHLGDGLCFDIFKQVQINKPAIFCTAFDKYALEAFDNNGIAYVLKPYNKGAIEKAVGKFLTLTQTNSYNIILKNLLAFADKLKREEKYVLVHYKDKILPISINAIAIFYIENDITKIYSFNHSIYTLSSNLDDIESQYPSKFFRANRQYLVNKKAVKEISKFFARKLLINLTIEFPHQIIVSKTKAPQFLNWLSN